MPKTDFTKAQKEIATAAFDRLRQATESVRQCAARYHETKTVYETAEYAFERAKGEEMRANAALLDLAREQTKAAS